MGRILFPKNDATFQGSGGFLFLIQDVLEGQHSSPVLLSFGIFLVRLRWDTSPKLGMPSFRTQEFPLCFFGLNIDPFQKEAGGSLFGSRSPFIEISQLQSFPRRVLTHFNGTPTRKRPFYFFSERLPVSCDAENKKAHDAPVHDIVRRHYNTVYRTLQWFGRWNTRGLVEPSHVFFQLKGGGSCFLIFFVCNSKKRLE